MLLTLPKPDLEPCLSRAPPLSPGKPSLPVPLTREVPETGVLHEEPGGPGFRFYLQLYL